MLKLKDIRESKGLTQLNLAKLMNVTQQTISRYENGVRHLNQDEIIKLSLILEVTPNELLGFEEAYQKYTDYLATLKEEEDTN